MGYYKDLFIKAGWAALYGAVAEFAISQSFDKATLYVALVAAGARAVIIFATTIKDELSKTTKASEKLSWKRNL